MVLEELEEVYGRGEVVGLVLPRVQVKP